MALSATTIAIISAINKSIADTGYAEKYEITYDGDTTEKQALDKIKELANIPEDQWNNIMGQLNLIVQQRQFRNMFDAERNDFRRFLVDMTEEGFGIEDVFQEVLDGHEPFWDDNDPQTRDGNSYGSWEDLTTQEKEKIKRKFHITPFEQQFKTSTDRRNYSKVFMLASQQRYMDNKLANLSVSAELYLMKTVIIGQIKELVESGEIIFNTAHNVADNQGIKNFLESVRATMGGMLQPTTAYNFDGVETITRSVDDLYIVTTPDVFERVKVQSYSGAFNLSEMEIKGKVIYAPNGTSFGNDPATNKPVNFLILDRNSIVVGLKRWLGSNFFVPNKHITNHWLTIEGVKGYNTMFNAMAYCVDGMEIEVGGKADVSIISTATGTAADGISVSDAEETIIEIDSSSSVNVAFKREVTPAVLTIADEVGISGGVQYAVYGNGNPIAIGVVAENGEVQVEIPYGVTSAVVNIGGYANPLQ